MRKILTLGVVLAAFAAIASTAIAANPIAAPFPATSVGPVFIAAQTVTATGAMQNQFAPGSRRPLPRLRDGFEDQEDPRREGRQVLLRHDPEPAERQADLPAEGSRSERPDGVDRALEGPGQPTRQAWSTSRCSSRRRASGPARSCRCRSRPSQLTIAASPQHLARRRAGGAGRSARSTDASVSLYADTVNGTQPVGAPKRAVGCSQTNVYKRGEQVVAPRVGLRPHDRGDALAPTTSTPPPIRSPASRVAPITYGAHGAAGNKVFFWSAPWIVPATFPLGDVTIHVTFKTTGGKTGTFDYPITIIP